MIDLRSLSAAALAAAVFACGGATPQELADGDDPLAALRSTARSARYDGSFWVAEAEARTRLWSAAIATCQGSDNATLPNCQTVGFVLSTLELEREAQEAKRKIEALLEERDSIFPPDRRPPASPDALPGDRP